MTVAIEVQEKPILFSGAMVRKIIEDLKTNTRRVMKPQPFLEHGKDGSWWFLDRSKDGYGKTNSAWKDGDKPFWTYCPYGKPGDRLWVRESFIHVDATYCYEASTSIPVDPARTIYRADETDPGYGPWKPSIHMPRDLSRLTLEIVSVKVERVQDISEEDAKAEGCPVIQVTHHPCSEIERLIKQKHGVGTYPAKRHFQFLWDSINAKTNPWSSNPWVWCITFRRIS